MDDDYTCKLVEYESVVKKDYVLREFQSVKFAVVLGLLFFAVAAWFLAVYSLPSSKTLLTVIWLVVTPLLIYGAWKNNGNQNGWVYLFADKSAVYFIFEPKEQQYLKVPWRMVGGIQSGVYSAFDRGLEFQVASGGLSKRDVGLLRSLPCVVVVGDDVRIKVLSGLRRRESAIETLSVLRDNNCVPD